jgi:hypothetical protein
MKRNYITSLFVLLFGLFFGPAHSQTMYISNPSSSYSVLEGNTFTFSVNLYSASNAPTVVDVTTTDGTAGALDYTAIPTTVTIPAGQLSSPLLVLTTTNDSSIEPNENLTINGMVTSGNTTNTSATLPLTIIDNDAVPTLSMYNWNINEGQITSAYAYLSNPYSSNVVFTIVTSNGTASASDFTAVSTTITILPVKHKQRLLLQQLMMQFRKLMKH